MDFVFSFLKSSYECCLVKNSMRKNARWSFKSVCTFFKTSLPSVLNNLLLLV